MNFSSYEKEAVLLAMSGTAEQIVFFMRAEAAKRGVDAQLSTLQFGALAQFVFSEKPVKGEELYLLTTFDFVPDGDWRSGFPEGQVDHDKILENAHALAERLARRRGAKFAYLPTPLLPIFTNDNERAVVEAEVLTMARQLGARELPLRLFSLASYFSTGCPFDGTCLGEVAGILDSMRHGPAPSICKVLVTDLDNVLWAGIVGEDGPEGVLAGAEGAGYAHFIYQNHLKKLKERGVLLAAVSRNDEAIATAPFLSGKMLLDEQDFIAIVASYNAKSAQIENLSQQLNLALDAFVYVDDNPVEVAEVTAALPDVTCLQFPSSSDGLPTLLTKLARCFDSATISEEDRNRTALYRRRLAAQPPSEAEGADLQDYLSKLEMHLVISECSAGQYDRAVQLINKTNQFNLNGKRFETEDVEKILASGGRMITAKLSDRMGGHGEIMACLINVGGTVLSWVMSCRVFQRQVEDAFMVWLAGQGRSSIPFAFVATERNVPAQNFFKDSSFCFVEDQTLLLDCPSFVERHGQSLSLFDLEDLSTSGE